MGVYWHQESRVRLCGPEMGNLSDLLLDGFSVNEFLSTPDESSFFRQLSCRVFESIYRASEGSLCVKSIQYVLVLPVGIIKELAGIPLS